MNIGRWGILAAIIEPAVTGLILLISPSVFAWLVLGNKLSETGQALGRLAGIVLFSLAFACWPDPAAASTSVSTVRALLIYNLLATIYLVYLGVGGILVGVLLWPAVALHAILAILVIHPGVVADRK